MDEQQRARDDQGPAGCDEAPAAPHDSMRDAEQGKAAPRVSARQRVLLIVLAACCVALIALCGVALATSGDSPSPVAGVAAQGSLASGEQTEAASGQDGSGQGVEEGAEDPSSSDGQETASGASPERASSDDASSKQASTQGGSDAHGGSGGGASGNAAAGNGSGNSGDSTPSQNKTVTVSVTVDSSAADGSVSGSGTFTFEEGATPYDALCALRSDVTSTWTSMGIYVQGIGGLFENDSRYPGISGWKYSVNGEVVMKAASNCTLHDGDRVVWYYTVTG